ncbi:CapA family protein [Aneurinibacillus sp. Ricciae_BoGa-3]|uniref:CapA family protein n=1 Tax=Aneurinibacillus sp. Ricciae_BoGa-3 TaxID=3022697 RepID=UPI002340BEB5|nr:CapA family protein [Aneurinibacillus sp. Ricciae_BoGa-3]WCK52736.1 CapA family protein [Aneurinibacillus sp. Ricciae_BoGa-3]
MIREKRTKIAMITSLLSACFLLFSNVLLVAPPATGNANSTVQPADRDVSLLFAGDMQFTGSVAEQIKKHGTSYPFAAVSPFFRQADLSLANLETTLTLRGTAQEKQYTFRSDPRMAQAMKQAGLSIVGLANNHTLDYGPISLTDTIAALDKQGMPHVGAGKNLADATNVFYTVKKGKKIAVLNYTWVMPSASWAAGSKKAGLASAYDPALMYSKVKEARKQAGVVIVFLHWGKERSEKPERYQVDTAHKLIDLGADIVVGSHPHVIQPIERYKNKLIAYSLGNFIFTRNSLDRCSQSALFSVNVQQGKLSAALIPVRITNGQPKPMQQKEKMPFLHYIDRISSSLSIKDSGQIIQ